MKEASGEFSMTIIVIVAAVAILTLLTTVLLPLARGYIEEKWGKMSTMGDSSIVAPIVEVVR